MSNESSYSTMYFFFNDTATTEIYTLSLHDALPIYGGRPPTRVRKAAPTSSNGPDPCRRGIRHLEAYEDPWRARAASGTGRSDRKSTRLNSSHANISYAVFCLKKKK